jgi:hypothetical protein
MTKKDIDDIISIICPNDEDFEKPCISPAYLKQELEALALEQEPVIDKIRAEIEARLCDVVSDYTDGYRTAIQGDLAILDKYKAESEE